MTTVHISKLSDLKSAFNSEDDNFHYYRVLSNSLGTTFGSVEFAQPVKKGNAGELHWLTNQALDLKNFQDFPEQEKALIGQSLKEALDAFEKATAAFKNAPTDFASKVMEIPDLTSLFASTTDPSKVVVTNWGFLEDKLDRKEGLIKSIFPAPECPILVSLKDEKGDPISGKAMTLSYVHGHRNATTDAAGYARFDHLPRHTPFSLSSNHIKLSPSTFTADGRTEYSATELPPKDVLLSFLVIDSNGNSVSQYALNFASTQKHSSLITNADGKCTQTVISTGQNFTIKNTEGVILLSDSIPGSNKEYIIKLPPVSFPDPLTETPELEAPEATAYLQFERNRSKALPGIPVTLLTDSGKKLKKANTNSLGRVEAPELKEDVSYQVQFEYKGEVWQHDFHHEKGTTAHIISPIPKYPWLWWVLIGLLSILLIWCLFFHNCGDWNGIVGVDNEEKEEVVIALPCNASTKSGGFGITKNVHDMGSLSGHVSLTYNMINVPDKLEVFSVGERLVSTEEVLGNDGGFVGDLNNAGCCGTLQFFFDASKASQCTVVVTGVGDSTKWHYSIACPIPSAS